MVAVPIMTLKSISVCPSIRQPPAHPSNPICPSIRPPVRPSIHPFIHPSISIYLSTELVSKCLGPKRLVSIGLGPNRLGAKTSVNLINWFRCHHSGMWQQAHNIVSLVLIALLVFWISQSDAALHKFWIAENKQLFFFIKKKIYCIFSYLLITIL